MQINGAGNTGSSPVDTSTSEKLQDIEKEKQEAKALKGPLKELAAVNFSNQLSKNQSDKAQQLA